MTLTPFPLTVRYRPHQPRSSASCGPPKASSAVSRRATGTTGPRTMAGLLRRVPPVSVTTVRSEGRLRLSRLLVWVAGALGVVHAAASLYWALGGRWLLATVGRWAVDLSVQAPLTADLALGLVALVKLLAAAVPIGVAYGKVGRRRFWRAVSWVGGLLLVVYGGINIVVSAAVLGGLIRPAGGYDLEAMRGHAYLWDPLFFLWGSALVLSLWFSHQEIPSRLGGRATTTVRRSNGRA